MLRYLYYRHWKFRPEFEKDNRIDPFAVYCMDATQDAVKRKGDKIRKYIRNLTDRKKSFIEKRERIPKDMILENDEYYNIRSKIRRLRFILILIFLAESGLNYFTSLIAIPVTDETKGIAFTLLRIALALVVTAIGIVCADQFFEEILPSKKYGVKEVTPPKKFNPMRMLVWLVGLVVIEYMIFHFGLARVNDIEGGAVNGDTAKSLIILSMVIPIVAGGIGWEISNFRDAYRNRRLYDRYTNCINHIDNKLENLRETENGYFQKKTNNYWHTYNRLKNFKEYYNSKKQRENVALLKENEFATDYDRVYAESLRRYNKHKEKQDAIERTKINTSETTPGKKIGQDSD